MTDKPILSAATDDDPVDLAQMLVECRLEFRAALARLAEPDGIERVKIAQAAVDQLFAELLKHARAMTPGQLATVYSLIRITGDDRYDESVISRVIDRALDQRDKGE